MNDERPPTGGLSYLGRACSGAEAFPPFRVIEGVHTTAEKSAIITADIPRT